MLTVRITGRARKEFNWLPRAHQQRIVVALTELGQCSHPLKHRHVVKLQGASQTSFRLRVGDYRVKFIFLKPRTVQVTHIHHRQIGYP